jgi:GNAT superfamily N-acetyltransferase
MVKVVFVYESARAYVELTDIGIPLLVDVRSRQKGKGHATGLLAKVCRWADTNKQDICLWVENRPNKSKNVLSTTQLISFYEKFGFEICGNPIPEIPMIRVGNGY